MWVTTRGQSFTEADPVDMSAIQGIPKHPHRHGRAKWWGRQGSNAFLDKPGALSHPPV